MSLTHNSLVLFVLWVFVALILLTSRQFYGLALQFRVLGEKKTVLYLSGVTSSHHLYPILR